ncbi:MAG TPA: PAS domain S-box protein [Methanospirillum sp.]|nr:PAS domain S-box protein [Methanospirillum sp.]
MDNVRDQIITTLSKKNKYLTISEISLQSGLDRHTVAKYLGILEVLGKVRKIEHGNAKKYYLITSVPVSGLIDISTDLIIIVNRGLQVQYINSAASDKLDLDKRSILGERIDLLKIDLFSSPEIIDSLKNYSPNKVFRTEIFHTDEILYLITILELSLDPGKNLIAITAEDITQKKKSESAIIESEEKYKALFTVSADPVILVDQETGSIIDVNPAACRVYGYEYDDFLLLNIVDISAETERTRQFIQNPVHFTPKRYHRNKNHRLFPVEIKGRIIIVSTMKDITERIIAEEAIAQTRINFETFFKNIDDFLFVLDEKGNILEINETVIKRLGYTRRDIIGGPAISLHPPDLQKEAAHIISEMIGGKTSVCPLPIMNKSGELIPVETRISRGLWDGIPAFFGVGKDLSNIILSEEKFSKTFHFSAMPRAISSIKDGSFFEVNAAFLECLGYSRNEVIGRTSKELGIYVSPDIRTEIIELSKNSDEVKKQEVLVRTKDGSVRTGLFSATRVQIADEMYLLTSMMDITHLKETEKNSPGKRRKISFTV